MILQLLSLFFFLLTNTERSFLFLCSHFFIESTSLFPFIFNTSGFIHRNIFAIETNLSTVVNQKWLWKPSCGGRVSCQKIGTTLAATTTAHWLWCVSVLFAYFIFSSSLFIPSECPAVWESSRVMSMRAATTAGLLSVGAFILLYGQSLVTLSACR